MKTRLLLLLSVCCIALHAQTVRVDFDTSGNLSVHVGDLLIKPFTPIDEISAVIGKPSLITADSGFVANLKDSTGQQKTKYKYTHFVFEEKGIHLVRDEYSGKWKQAGFFFSDRRDGPKTQNFRGTMIFNGDTITRDLTRNNFIVGKEQAKGWYFMPDIVYKRGNNTVVSFIFFLKLKITSVYVQWDADMK